MEKYFFLKPQFRICGYDKLPYCIINRANGAVLFLQDEDELHALNLADGQTDISSFIISPKLRELLLLAEKNGIVESTDVPSPIQPEQKYHRYQNRYIGRAHWSITGACNYKCRHCFLSAPEAKFGELSREVCLEIINQLAECGITQISLTGGEPLVRKDFLELVDVLCEKEIRITQIYSNGALVNENLLNALDSRGLHPEFNMSFDGIGWHNWMRGVPNAEEAVLRAFRLCHEKGFPTGAEMCLHKKNVHTLGESIKLLAGCGVDNLKVTPVVESGLWCDETDNTLESAELLEIYLAYIPQFFADGCPINLQLGGFFHCDRQGHWSCAGARGNGQPEVMQNCLCGSARNTMYISPDGRLLPCIPLSDSSIAKDFPNITEIGLKQGLCDSSYLKHIDTRVKELMSHCDECANCKDQYICCGGCRASAILASGDYLGKDPAMCEIFKGGYYDKLIALMKTIPANKNSISDTL